MDSQPRTTPRDETPGDVLLRGTPVSPGIAIGTACIRTSGLDSVSVRKIGEREIEPEIRRFRTALDRTKDQLFALRDDLANGGRLEADEVRIFESHAACLDDPVFRSDVEKGIRDAHLNLEGSLSRVISNFARIFELVENTHLKEKISDIREVASRILDNLTDDAPADAADTATLPPAGNGQILVTDELRMSDLLGTSDRRLAGIVAERGTRTSHASLMARSLGIPMVAGLPNITEDLESGDSLLIDGNIGTVFPHPPAEVREEYEALERDLDARADGYGDLLEGDCETADGVRVHLYASASKPTDIALIRTFGMEGVGLYRTETPYLDSSTLPSEESLTTTFRDVSIAAGDGPAVIRLLNLGSARGIAGRTLEREPNPALGNRALRLLFEDHQIFASQVRAILRANERGNLRLLLPFVTDLDDLRDARTFISTCARDLIAEGMNPDQVPPVGCLIEVPGIVPMLPRLIQEADFLTISIDNLAQFSMGADRVNPAVASYLDMCQPGLLHQMRSIFETIGDTPIVAYGEMVRDHRYAYLLLGLGLRRFCLPPYSAPRLKSLLKRANHEEARQFANEVLRLDTKGAVRRALESHTADLMSEAHNKT